jgi:hypothetical protein
VESIARRVEKVGVGLGCFKDVEGHLVPDVDARGRAVGRMSVDDDDWKVSLLGSSKM